MPGNARSSFRKKKAAFDRRFMRLQDPTSYGPPFTEKRYRPDAKQDKRAANLRDDVLIENQKIRMAKRLPLSLKRMALAPVALSFLTIPLFVGVVSTSAVAQAPIPPQSIPMPKAAPKNRDSDGQRGPITTGAMQAPPTPFIPDPHRNLPLSIFATFDDKQKAEAAKISSYLSSLQTLVGNFVQVGPDGSKSKGQFFIQKPGRVRFEYDPPNPIAIVADGSMVAVRDRNLETQDLYPLSQTPLRYLLSDRIDLMKDTNVVSVTADDMYLSVTIEEHQLLTGTSRLMLMVGAKDGQLKQWTVTDPQGYDTTVAVYNLDTSKKVDPGMFKIDTTEKTFPPG
jgi:outer membrane lipoprotein-sorting protein